MKKQRRVFMFIIAAALATALFSLPLLLSLGPVVQYGLTLLNQKFAGTLQVQSCSLGWQQGLRCQGVTYEDPRQGLRLDAPGLSSDKGLLVLLAAPRYLGAFTLDQPVVTLSPPKKDRQQQSGSRDQEFTAFGTARSERPWWERTTLRLSVNQGTIQVASEDGCRQSLATEVQLEGSVAGGIVNYALDFFSGLEQEGSLRIQGHINLPPSGDFLGAALTSRAELKIRGMDIAPFLKVAASRSDLPQGSGRLDATCSLRTAGLQDLTLEGTAHLRDVRLFGGMLGSDQPLVWEFPLSLQTHGAYRHGKVIISELLFYGPFFEALGHGDRDDFSFRVSGDLDAMSAQLGQLFTFPLRGRGQLQLTGSLEATRDGGYQLVTRTSISDFVLSTGAVPLLPAHDFLLTLQGRIPSWSDRDQIFRNLELEGVSWPGTLSLVLEGRQNRDGQTCTFLTARGNVDLARSTSLLQGFGYDPAGIGLKGALSFAGTGSWQRRRLSLHSLNAVVNDLTVTGKKGLIYQEQQLTVEVKNQLPTEDGRVVVRELLVTEGWQDFIDVGRGGAVWIDFHQQQVGVQHLHVNGERASAQIALRLDDWRDPLPLQDLVVEVRLHDIVANPEADVEALKEAIQTQLAVAVQSMFSAEGEINEIEPGSEAKNTQQRDWNLDP